MPLCDALDCVHLHDEGLHRGLLSLRVPLILPKLLGVSILVSLSVVLALTENCCHCHTLLFFTCSDDSLSLSGHRHLLRNVIRTEVSCDCASYS